MESSHRIEASVEAKDIFVEVSLQMLWVNSPVMRSLDPSLHVTEDEMDHGQVRLRLVRVASERQRLMVVSIRQRRITSPSVRANDRAASDVVVDKRRERGGAAIRHNAK